jgi:hypothetical protein
MQIKQVKQSRGQTQAFFLHHLEFVPKQGSIYVVLFKELLTIWI